VKTISLEEFFSENKTVLEQWYSGISISRLEDELHSFLSNKRGSKKTFQTLILKGIPLEQINQKAYFYRSEFFVNEDVLIPRSETEILVEDAINHIEKNYSPGYKVADIGVGSFCIGISILIDVKKELYLWGGDICPKALKVAKQNLDKHKKSYHENSNVILSLSDRLDRTEDKFNLIVSNPPYIREEKDRDGVHKQTLQFEPHLALFLPDEEFDMWFRKLFSSVKKKLESQGLFMMEGHEDTLDKLAVLAKEEFSNVEVKLDYTHRPRFLHCSN